MLHFFSGTDRDTARGAMNAEIERTAKKLQAEVLRVSDANTLEDLHAALQGPGMFGVARILVLEGVCANEEMLPIMLETLPRLSKSGESVFLYEEKPNADLRRKIEKYSETRVRHDAPGKAKDNTVFALAGALAKGDRKTLWVGYQRALARDERVEAIHGILFWGAKKMLLSARKNSVEYHRGSELVAGLAELPHEARRRGFELEYALERFILSQSS